MTKIMLVEDDNNLREIYQARLEAEGYEIVSAMDGEAALAIASKELPDLVISDVMMPKISGFEMLDILRNTEALKNVKIIMLTALGQTEDSTRASNLGADRYLVKSQVTLEDIVKATHDLLDGPAAAPPAAPTSAAPSEPSTTPAGLTDSSSAASVTSDDATDDLHLTSSTPTPTPTPTPTQQFQQPVSAPEAPTPTLQVVEAPAEESEEATSASLPSVPSSEAEIEQAAPVPAAQEEASINNQIKEFISNTDDAPVPPVVPASAPPAPEPDVAPVTEEAAPTAPEAPAPTTYSATPVPPQQPSAPPTPITVASEAEDLGDFEPKPEQLDEIKPPTITEDSPATPAFGRQPSDSQPDADKEMANAISGLTPGGETEDAPSGSPNTQAPGNRPIPVTDASAATDDDEDTPKKKIISPLHDLSDRPDINKLLELEESKNAAQQAARTTDANGGNGSNAAPGQQQPFNAPSVDPNSISL